MLGTNGRSVQYQFASIGSCVFSCRHRSLDVAVRRIRTNTLASAPLAAATAAAAIAARR